MAKATHKLDGGGGYLTSLELENQAAATDHAAVDDGDDSDSDTGDTTDDAADGSIAQAA